MPGIGEIFIHNTIEVAVLGWFHAGPPESLAQVHPAEHHRLVGVGKMSAEVTRHCKIIEQISNTERWCVVLYITVDACNVSISDARVDRLRRKYSSPFVPVLYAIRITDDVHAVCRYVTRHLIPGPILSVPLLALRKKPMKLIEYGIPGF